MSRGSLIFANNNSKVDYGLVALCASLMLKAHIKEKSVALVTDKGTIEHLRRITSPALVDYAFDHVIPQAYATVRAGANNRAFHDTSSAVHTLPWYNGGRSSAYDLSPYDETLLIDADYLIQSDWLDQVWGHREDVMINSQTIMLTHEPRPVLDRRVDAVGIPLLWATVVYFKKSERAELLFRLVDHIRVNYEFYRYLYHFNGRLYRNDIAFSIAAHVLNGFLENDDFRALPVPHLLMSGDKDQLVNVEKNRLMFLVNDEKNSSDYHLSNVAGLNVHCMNKFSIVRHADKIIQLYAPKDLVVEVKQ